MLLALSMALAFAAFQHLPSLGSLIAARMTGEASGAGVPMVVGILALACATYPAGRLMDRAGRRPVLIVGHLLSLLRVTAELAAWPTSLADAGCWPPAVASLSPAPRSLG